MSHKLTHASLLNFNTRAVNAVDAIFHVTLWPWDGMSVADMEAWFMRVYESMGCEPYERKEWAH